MKRIIRHIYLRFHLSRLIRHGESVMRDYLRVAEAFECSVWELEAFQPWTARYRLRATLCAKRARRIARRLKSRRGQSVLPH